MLPSERRRNEDIAALEAAGETVWTPAFGPTARVRLVAILRRLSEEIATRTHTGLGREVADVVALRVGRIVTTELTDFLRTRDDDELLDWLGASYMVVQAHLNLAFAEEFASHVNRVLNEERVAYKFVQGELISFESDELLKGVVEPSLRLLVGRRFAPANDAYMKALKEISSGDPGDAITDAGTALQETLTALGCEGDVLSSLIKDAKTRGLFKQHDQQLHEAVMLVAKWAASERNKNSDAHKTTDAVLADAWLMVHVVGALIVRLVEPTKRGDGVV